MVLLRHRAVGSRAPVLHCTVPGLITTQKSPSNTATELMLRFIFLRQG